jgi:hypothetical protein
MAARNEAVLRVLLPPRLPLLAPVEAAVSDDYRRRRTAAHEASHAAMAWLLGWELVFVSIRPGDHFRGVTRFTLPWRPLDEVDGILARRDPSGTLLERYGIQPVPLFDPELRRKVETEMMVTLAGAAGEWWAGPPESGYVADDLDRERAEKLASDLIGLSESQAASLADLEQRELPCDWDNAFREASMLEAGDDLAAGALVRWMELGTQRIVATQLFGRLVGALMPVLLQAEVLSGEDAARILRETAPEDALATASVGSGSYADEREVAEVKITTRGREEVGELTPIGQFMICTRRIIRSVAGPCEVGMILHRDDERAGLAPECFASVMTMVSV